MQTLKVITINQNEIWDNIVRSFINYDVNYLSGYSKAFQLQGEGEPLLFYYDDGNTRAMNVVMKRDIALAKPFIDKLSLNTWFDLSTPYGYGGFWIEGDNYTAVNKAFDSYCYENGFISEFVRFHLLSDFYSYYTGLSESSNRNVIRTLELPLDEMQMDFEHRARKSLKKAKKAGLEVKIDTSGERLNDFLNIYHRTMDRTNAKETFYFSKEFFETLNQMQDNFVYVHIIYQDVIISTELVLYGSENCYSFLGGTNPDYFNLQANTLLKYEIIKWGKEKGLKRFILGGGYGSEDGIYKYKKSFAPNDIHDFYIGKKIFNQEKYDKLLKIRIDNDLTPNNKDFFPSYRAE